MSAHPAGGTAREGLPSASKDFYLFHTTEGPHLLLVDGSQIFKIDDELGRALAAASAQGGEAARALLAEHGLGLEAIHRR